VKPLRRDAELNLERIMEAARDVFAESGYDGSMEQIAALAEVGIGTLYRRFPHKEDLLNAVTDLAKERTIRIGEEVSAEVIPQDALFEFLRRCIATPSSWRVTTARPPWSESAGVNSVLKAITPVVDEVLHRSQDAGAVRKDIVFSDVILALMSVRAVADLCGSAAPTASKRFLELVLDGLRPGLSTPVTGHERSTAQPCTHASTPEGGGRRPPLEAPGQLRVSSGTSLIVGSTEIAQDGHREPGRPPCGRRHRSGGPGRCR
jgi:AcrR family transcriptional regulator